MSDIDLVATELAIRNGMPPDLRVPKAARDIEAIEKYIGKTTPIFQRSNNALIVTPHLIPIPNKKLPIWKAEGVELLHFPTQVWVHVKYTNYRKAYKKAFPDQDIKNHVIDHIMNRRVAALKRYEYVRVVPISRSANSSSGNITEKYEFEYHNSEYMRKVNSENKAFIQYCDMADIVKMLNIKTGGKVQEGINDVLYYFFEEK